MGTSIYDQYKALNAQEKQYLFWHPHHVLPIRKAEEAAFAATASMFGSNGHNDQSDAFRHCFWSALLARDLGYGDAYLFTTAHESSPGNPPDEKAMDLHNNLVGLSIGRVGGIDELLKQRCRDALKRGQLKVLVK